MNSKDRADLIKRISDIEGLTDKERSALLGLLRENKTYGLVWEDKPEDIEERLRDELPILTEVPERAIISEDKDAPNHILIEGDNLEALATLAYTHEGKVDVIYIDPPYNTGARNWKYNNDYVDKDDDFKHSKFISFINKRLRLAKRLLSKEGIIICAIDDYEIHNVRMIMDEIFGELNRLGTIVIVHNPRGRNDDAFIATMHEYLLVYAFDATVAQIGHFNITKEEAEKEFRKTDEISAYAETSYIRTGNNSLRTERPGLWYEIYYNPIADSLDLKRSSNKDILLFPINGKGEERCWRWSPDTFLNKKDTELFVKKVKGEYKIYKKRRVTEMLGRKPKTVWTDSKYDASSNGIMLLQNIFDGKNPFPYPKSLYAVFDSLYITSKSNSVILDFFAGSGTTLHATIQLNAEYGGNRQCILITNNENNICEEVTYERNKRVVNGYTTPKGEVVAGLKKNNIRYYRTGFVGRSRSMQNMRKLVNLATDMLCIKEDLYTEQPMFGEQKTHKGIFRYFDNGSKQMLIIYREEAIDELVDIIYGMDITTPIKVYVFSPSEDPWEGSFEEVSEKVELCALPQAIYNTYRRILPKKRDAIIMPEDDVLAQDDNKITLDGMLNFTEEGEEA